MQLKQLTNYLAIKCSNWTTQSVEFKFMTAESYLKIVNLKNRFLIKILSYAIYHY